MPGHIRFHSIDVPLPGLELDRVCTWLEEVAEDFLIARLDYHFCSDAHLLEMNRTHLDHDEYTDIITFDDSKHPIIRGSIYISVDRVNENAGIHSEDPDRELCRVIVHGLLHLMGQKDKSAEDAAMMRSREEQSLALWTSRDSD